MSSSFDNV